MLAGWLMGAIVAAGLPAVEPPSFCARMAATLPMKEKVSGGRRVFDMQTLNAAQRLLVGGTAMVSMGVAPLDDTAAERARVRGMCRAGACTITGPAELHLWLKDGVEHVFAARAGEQARVGMVGSRIRCGDL